MPFIPHTPEDVESMLDVIGADSIEALFDEIPADLRADGLPGVPGRLNELAVSQLIKQQAAKDPVLSCFVGAGAYEHHIPAAVWEITTRGEFYSAYTPYQAEASQGTLQLIYEFQTMMASLLEMDVSNASLYDGASGLAEAVLMAVRANRRSKSKRILMPTTVHPAYRKVVSTITRAQGVELIEIPYDKRSGNIQLESLADFEGKDITAVVIPQPNFFGVLEEVDSLTDWVHQQGALAIGLVNPLAMSLLTPPGEWGDKGVDIACGEGQPLGVPLASGGPYFGFMCCTKALVRQMPGRIVGATVDQKGKKGFALTLQAREQHIRRSKATSNICTNQGLLVTAATIHMAIMGAHGLSTTASICHNNNEKLVAGLTAINGVERLFGSPSFHEGVITVDADITTLLAGLAEKGILGGYDLSQHYPELGQALLVCATETKTVEDIEDYIASFERVLVEVRS